jgi:glycine dehydrogenase subunit 1
MVCAVSTVWQADSHAAAPFAEGLPMALSRAHPFMPNSARPVKVALLAELGLNSTEPLFAQIPAAHRLAALPDLPPALSSEVELSRHLHALIDRNRPAGLSFLGGGIWQHHVPAVVDEIVGRAEFLTPVWGTPSSDFGRNQVWWEFTSQLGALLNLELVGLPVYSWGAAAGHALRMAARLTGRTRIILPAAICPERLAVIRGYAESADAAMRLELVLAPCDAVGRLDLAAVAALADAATAAIYYENPAYPGGLETGAAALADIAARVGAQTIAGVDPLSLGVIAPPGELGADIAVGTIQTLGVHCHAGGGLGGFIATRDEARYAAEYPTLLNSLTTTVDGELAFGLMLFHQSSYGSRELGKDWTGNSTYLWAVAAATYMALLGPAGFAEVGRLILARTRFAAETLAGVNGVRVVEPHGSFRELQLDFSASGQSAAAINRALLDRHGIFGGIEITPDRALFAFTECHTEADIRQLADALREILA